MLRIVILTISIFFLISCQKNIEQIKVLNRFEERNNQLKKSIKETSIDFGLVPLADKAVSNGDIEIRFYHFGNSYIMPAYNDLLIKQNVFILKRINSEWSASIIRDTFDVKEKRIIEQVSPISGWDNLFQQLSDKEILTVSPDKDEDDYNDATLYVIETNINHKYQVAYSQVPSEASKEKGSKQIAKLFNLVFKEFGATDFQAPTNLSE